MNSQDSLTEQLRRVILLANQNGEYNAADWLTTQLSEITQPKDMRDERNGGTRY